MFLRKPVFSKGKINGLTKKKESTVWEKNYRPVSWMRGH